MVKVWTSPAQFAVMYWLCWKYQEKLGYGEVTATWIGGRAGLSENRVRAMYRELEAGRAMARIGSEGAGRMQRFVVTLDKAIAHARRGQGVSAGDQGGYSPAIRGGDRGRVGGYPPADTLSRQGVQGTEGTQVSHAATAAPRLPFSIVQSTDRHRELVAAAEKERLRRLRDNVAGKARSLLKNPTFAREVLNGEEIGENLGALYSATKLLCQRKRVVGYGDVAYAMCASELFKFLHPDVVAGTAPRPRDRRRAQR